MADYAPHPSHKMGEWESDVVVMVPSTPRFGRVRMCSQCGGEQAETVAGKAWDNELDAPCLSLEGGRR